MKTHALKPTAADIASARNLSPNAFPSMPDGWICPVCARDIAKMVYSGRAGDWRYQVVLHHDHGIPARFEPVAICSDCNNIDGRVKKYARKLRVQLPHEDWSFSVSDMLTIVKEAVNHGKPELDYQKAVMLALEIVGYSSATVQGGSR